MSRAYDPLGRRLAAVESMRSALVESGDFLRQAGGQPCDDHGRIEREVVMGAFIGRRLTELAGEPEALEGQAFLVWKYPPLPEEALDPLSRTLRFIEPWLGYDLRQREGTSRKFRSIMNSLVHAQVFSITETMNHKREHVLHSVLFASDREWNDGVYEMTVRSLGFLYRVAADAESKPL